MDIIAFSIGNFDLYWYGVMTSLAILAGILITGVNLYFRRESYDQALDILIYSIPVGLICARLTYVFLHWELYQGQLTEILAISHGGMSIYGAGVGFVLTVVVYAYCKRLYLWSWLDVFAPAILLGIAVDQLGHFALQASVGMPVASNLSANYRIIEYVEYAFRPSGFEGYEYFWPVALYLFFWQLCGFLAITVLSYLQSRCGILREGNLFLLGMMCAALGRFGFGFLYLSSMPGVRLHFGQIICLVGLILCFCLIGARKFMPRHVVVRRLFRL